MTTSAGGMEGRCPRRRSTSSATAGGGEITRKNWGRRWRDHQKELGKAVGKATGWKAGRCRHVQISELFSIEQCGQAVMDFLAATEVGKFPAILK